MNYDRTITAMANERQFQAVCATTGEKDACLVEQQGSDDAANHWPQTSGADTQSRPVEVDEPETVAQTRQITHSQPMPIRVKAAPSSPRQTPPPRALENET